MKSIYFWRVYKKDKKMIYSNNLDKRPYILNKITR